MQSEKIYDNMGIFDLELVKGKCAEIMKNYWNILILSKPKLRTYVVKTYPSIDPIVAPPPPDLINI